MSYDLKLCLLGVYGIMWPSMRSMTYIRKGWTSAGQHDFKYSRSSIEMSGSSSSNLLGFCVCRPFKGKKSKRWLDIVNGFSTRRWNGGESSAYTKWSWGPRIESFKQTISQERLSWKKTEDVSKDDLTMSHHVLIDGNFSTSLAKLTKEFPKRFPFELLCIV